jgi:hypothetical protein
MHGSAALKTTGGDSAVLDYYTQQSSMSDPGAYRAAFADLPDDPTGIVRAIHGLMLYEHVAEAFYGVRLTEGQHAEAHVRPIEAVLATMLAHDHRPLTIAREPAERFVCICRSFALLAVSMMREKGIPARMRGGFGAYFNPETFEDHWVCEYWHASEERWALADPQFDPLWVEKFQLTHDPMDVPRDQFITSANAWRACRDGALDPGRFGIAFGNLRGLWFVAASLVRDLAALNKAETLPWDVWGAQPGEGWQATEAELAFFDEITEATIDPDANFDVVRRLGADERLHVPERVFNALLQREEASAV